MAVQPWHIVVVCTAFKVMIIPAYRSTDFEVHRHWLALTHSLPISQWYTDETSQWTLDYPPFFAWFEWALSHAGRLVDPAMLVLGNLNYASYETLVFQRCTVIASEFLLLAAAWYATRHSRRELRLLALFLVAANPGLIVVDHIHFQYNGVLLGLFVLSMTLVSEGRDRAGGLVFAVLLNCKHIYLYAAPVYFVHLLRHHCRGSGAGRRFLLLGGCVAALFALSFGPFIALGQMQQVMRRLFPFARGLCHAYWAPNAWALYAAADKGLAAVLPWLGVHINKPAASMTGGLVGVAEFAVLPQVGSGTAALAVLAAMAPCLVATWRDPRPSRFPAAVLYCTMCSFMLGYHVHEKAILMAVVPLGVVVGAHPTPAIARDYLFLSTLGAYSLFPLLFGLDEYPIKVLLLVLYSFLTAALFRDYIMPPAAGSLSRLPKRTPARASSTPASEHGNCSETMGQGSTEVEDDTAQKGGTKQEEAESDAVQPEGAAVLPQYERWYLYCLVPLEVYCTILHRLLLRGRLPFVPLMLTSVYCAGGMVYAWARMAAPFWVEAGAKAQQQRQKQG